MVQLVHMVHVVQLIYVHVVHMVRVILWYMWYSWYMYMWYSSGLGLGKSEPPGAKHQEAFNKHAIGGVTYLRHVCCDRDLLP